MAAARRVCLAVIAACATRAAADRLTEEGLEMEVPARETRCVYDELAEGQAATLEVFVLSGGAMDVDVAVDGPFPLDEQTFLPRGARKRGDGPDALPSKPAARVSVKSGGDGERFAAPTSIALAAPTGGPGAYRICLDNSGSRLTEKLVALNVRKAAVAGDSEPVRRKSSDGAEKTGKNDEAVAAVEARVVALRGQLAELKEKQARERRRLAKHEALYDTRHNNMVEASLLETVVYVVCSAFQIFFVRRWFKGKGMLPMTYQGAGCGWRRGNAMMTERYSQAQITRQLRRAC